MKLHILQALTQLALAVCLLLGVSARSRLGAEEAEVAEFAEFSEYTAGTGEDSLRVIPYGALWADMIFATHRTYPGTYTLYVPSRDDEGESAFAIDGRRTRLGLNIQGPGIEALEDSLSAGRIEIDFEGSFVTENRAGVLLRHAYWELKNLEWRLLVGQTDDVASPLSPNTINYAVGYNAGNIGFRRAQFRLEHTREFGPDVLLSSQGSLNQDIVTDFPTEVGIRRESSNWPVVEGRLQLAVNSLPASSSLNVGISGHVGETGFDFLTAGPPPGLLAAVDDARFITWSCNLDFQVTIDDLWRVRGDFFHGANLSSFLGGIGQGVCPCERVPIRATGGWIELGWDWTAGWRSHVGIGIDDPNNDDSQVGRILNRALYANLLYDVSPNLTTGLEVTSWKTLYHDLRAGQVPPNLLISTSPGEALTIDWTVRYGF